MNKARYLLLLLCGLWVLPLSAAPLLLEHADSDRFQLELLAEDLGVPWGLSFIAPQRLLFTDRAGRVGVLATDSGAVSWLQGAPAVMARGQGGLLDVAVPPDYPSTEWLYFTFSRAQDGQGVTVLARAKLRDHRLQAWQDLLVTRSASDTGRHFGSRIAFDDRGHLFFTVGDRGVRANGQDLRSHAGAVLRLNRETIPSWGVATPCRKSGVMDIATRRGWCLTASASACG